MDLGEILTERPGFTKMVDDNIEGLRANFKKTKYLLTQKVSDDNFKEAFQNFYNIVSVVPLLTNKIAIPQMVRARPNFGGEMFTQKADVSYNWKNRHKIELGRFNSMYFWKSGSSSLLVCDPFTPELLRQQESVERSDAFNYSSVLVRFQSPGYRDESITHMDMA